MRGLRRFEAQVILLALFGSQVLMVFLWGVLT